MRKAGWLITGLCLAALPVLAADTGALTQESRATVKAFFGQLKGELETAMKAGGPVNAIQVCNKVAPAIAEDLSKQYQGKVARTSLKYRNRANKPDAWETRVMQDFEQRKAAGTPVEALEVAEVVQQDGKRVFRYMKAIPTGEVCLKCHGQKIDPAVTARLDELYPGDMARGFAQGDLRGAFTLVKELD